MANGTPDPRNAIDPYSSMGPPQQMDPNDHPSSNIAAPGGVPLGSSGQSFAADAMDMNSMARALAGKYKVSKKKGKSKGK